jgi:hypothetical protein
VNVVNEFIKKEIQKHLSAAEQFRQQIELAEEEYRMSLRREKENGIGG